MILIYCIAFVVLIVLSAFFSSSETSILSINRIRLKHRAKKNKKKAIILNNILNKPESFFSMILLGNNLVNIAAASISTMLTAKLLNFGDELTLIFSTVFTTIIILFFAEIIPKTYAFRYSEKIAYSYAYSLKLLSILFIPFVFIITKISNLFIPSKKNDDIKNKLTIKEIKYFLRTEIELFRYNPNVLKMVNEIIDIHSKDIKTLMTPRPNIVALEENAGISVLKKILLEKKFSKIPVYRKNLDNIVGILIAKNILNKIIKDDISNIDIKTIMVSPVVVSEYSSIKYVLEEFKRTKINIAVILDEYGITLGMITINDIFKEILGEVEFTKNNIINVSKNTYIIKGSYSVEELNRKYDLDLNESKDYTTVSGMFIYHFGKFPNKDDIIELKNCIFKIRVMGDNKIEELELEINEKKEG